MSTAAHDPAGTPETATTDRRETLSHRSTPPPSRWRWAWYLPGVLAVLWGVRGLLIDPRGPDPLKWAVFVIVGVVVHDAIIAPVAVAVGWVLVRLTPAPVRAPLQVGLLASGMLSLAAFALVMGRGYSSSIPSALPFDYGLRLAVLLAVVWVAVLGWIALRLVRGRDRTAGSPTARRAQAG